MTTAEPMRITVILCTYNRRCSLPMALASLAAQVLPNGVEWETLIIDNNSTDDTRDIAEEYCRKFPDRFRYVFEAQQGKSQALNRGIHEASGEVIAFIDDDVTAEPDWLAGLLAGPAWPALAGLDLFGLSHLHLRLAAVLPRIDRRLLRLNVGQVAFTSEQLSLHLTVGVKVYRWADLRELSVAVTHIPGVEGVVLREVRAEPRK